MFHGAQKKMQETQISTLQLREVCGSVWSFGAAFEIAASGWLTYRTGFPFIVFCRPPSLRQAKSAWLFQTMNGPIDPRTPDP
jgi:hypothetical protein